MAQENQDGGLISRYLLGRLPEDELEQLEERMMADSELFDQVLLAEDEMVEAYVNGDLPESDVADFRASFLSTAEGRQQVAYAKALREHVESVPTSRAGDDAGGSEDPGSRQGAAEALEKEESAEMPVADERFLKSNVVHPPVWWRRPERDSYVKLAAAAVLVIGIGLGIWVIIPKSKVSEGLSTLAYAYREQRPIEARISGFDYAPASTTRGGEPKIDKTARNLAENILLDAVLKHPNAATHHAAGQLYLAEKKFDEAIEQFEEALKTDPNNAKLHSDYGAALLEKGKDDREESKSGKSLEEFARALEHLSRALELDGSLLDALFNRALCYEHLALYRDAEKDWNDYIKRDPNSKWADEARQKLKDLLARPRQTAQDKEQLFNDFLHAYRTNDDGRAWKIISETRESTGSFIFNRLIDDHLDKMRKGQNDVAMERLDALSYAAGLEGHRARDFFLSDLVRFYKSATLVQREKVLQARSFMRSGHENYAKSNFDVALESYGKARDGFEAANDSCEAAHVACLIGNCYVQQSNAKLGLSILEPLAHTFEKKGYKWSLARTLNAMCTGNQYLRDFSAAISNANRSLSLSEETTDIIGAVRNRYLLAATYRFVNENHEALDLYARDLSLAGNYTSQPIELWRHYASISLTLDQLGYYAPAIAFQKEALQLAIEAETPRFACRSYSFLGFLNAEHGEYVEAANNITRALEIADTLLEKRVSTEAKAYSFLQLGYVYRKLRAYDSAIENYAQAIRSYDEIGSTFFDYTARKEKLLCCIERGECPLVESELEDVLKLFEEHRSKILEESIRNSFFDAEQTIYDVAIEFEYSNKRDSRRAFEYSERSRGRSLRDLASTNVRIIDDPNRPDMGFREVSQPLSVEAIQERMPMESQILQYAVLKNAVLIWVVSKEGFPAVEQQITIDELNKKVGSFLQLISASDADSEALSLEAASLYDLLIKPIGHLLDHSKQLCIVPDKILNYLPFAALKSRNSGEYFIEEQKHGFVLSPSSNMFILCSEAAREKGPTRSERVLSVGNPLFDRQAFDDLPSADREATAIGGYYESARLVVGAAATKSRVMGEMEKSEVIHLATHAVADEWYPLRSKLLLTRDGSDPSRKDSDGVVQAYEIFRLNLARVKLVVLSACGTAVGKYYRGEGMIGFARSFIAQRIPMVVSSLWPVDSDATARLMINFHRLRKREELPTTEALRQAQLEMLRGTGSDRQPRNWASFVVIGGYANY